MPASTDSSVNIAAIDEDRLRSELENSAARYHVIAAWVAIVFNPLFGIGDYLNIPDDWEKIVIVRIIVGLLTLITLYFHNRRKVSTFFFVFVPILLISFQNAYTYSLIGPENILGHNLNVLALYLGAGLFVIWPLAYSIIAIGASALASFIVIYLNENIDFSDFAVDGGILMITGGVFSILLIHARYRSRIREIRARIALENAVQITEDQRDEIKEKSEVLEKQAQALADANAKIEVANSKLVNQNEQLEEKVGQRTAALRKTSQERNKLVYRLGHDFRTPMVNIRSFVGLIENNVDEQNREELFERIYQSLDQFDNLVLNMASFPVYTREKIEAESTDVPSVLETAWEAFANLRHAGDALEIENQLTAPVVTDPEKFKVIAQTILSNALHFRPESAAIKVQVTLSQHKDQLQVRFVDNGSGIRPEILPKVRGMFFRGDQRSKGIGLGLYLAQGIAHQLGGELKIESTVSVGTTVTVTLVTA